MTGLVDVGVINNSLVKRAAEEFNRGNYERALDVYRQLCVLIGEDHFKANIELCLRRLSAGGTPGSGRNPISTKPACDSIGNPKKPRVLVFSNINLSAIDGSTVFVANVCNLFQKVGAQVHLLTCSDVGKNWRDRVSSFDEMSVFQCESNRVKDEIIRLDTEVGYDWIFVRAWGERGAWFDPHFADKLIYYWPLQLEPTEEDRKIYFSVRVVAFQTELLRQKVFQQLGPKNSILLPPLVESRKGRSSREQSEDGVVRLSYTGTLRPECYSLEMLQAIETVAAEDDRLYFHLAIGKIFYKDPRVRSELNVILDRLRLNPRVTIETQVPASRCDEILFSSDISFSLWEPVPQNLYQVSTKLLECLKEGCHVICFETPLYKEVLGASYPGFIRHISELNLALRDAIARQRNGEGRYTNAYLLSTYSFAAQAVRLSSNLGLKFPTRTNELLEQKLFSEQFDEIYGLYVDENERKKLTYLSKKAGIQLRLFRGVNGALELAEEFYRYLERPLAGEWELAAKKKRLSVGAFGHLASFIAIGKDALRNKLKKILVLEADAILHKDIFRLNAEYRPTDFKVWYLGAGKWEPNVSYTSNGRFYHPYKTTGTFAVAFDASVLEECIEEWERFVDPTDVALWKVTDRYQEQCFVSCPNLIICDVAKSKTGVPRSQVEISRRFGWDLSEYTLEGIEHIGKRVARVRVALDHYMPGAWMNFVGNGFHRRVKVSSQVVELDLAEFVESVEYAGVFIRSIEYIY